MSVRTRLLAALAIGIVLVCAAREQATRAQATASGPIAVTVGSATASPALPSSFLGFSMEFSALHVYAGRDPDAVDPVFLALVGAVDPGSSPVLRIGGNSTDQTWWPVRGVLPSGGVRYSLTRNWLAVAHAVAARLGARFVLGVDLAAAQPALAAAEARALVAGIGRRYIDALEIGNEPDLYAQDTWYQTRSGINVTARRSGWNPQQYVAQFALWRRLMPHGVGIAGPALAFGGWMSALPSLFATGPLAAVTYHRYPLVSCPQPPTSSTYASIPNLLSDASSEGLAAPVAAFAKTAHAEGAPFRLDEINSSACQGTRGVSNTLASAVWVLDTLYNLAAAGVDAVNVHTLPGSAYAPFSFTHTASGWTAEVNPVYYGMLMFSEAFPAGAHLESVSVPQGPLKAYATVDPSATTRIMLVNKDPSQAASVSVTYPGGGQQPVSSELLTGPSAASTSGITLGGRSFASPTTTGVLAPPVASTVSPVLGSYDVTVPPASALLLTAN